MATSRLSTKKSETVRPTEEVRLASRREPPRGPQPYPAEKARAGEIILRTPARRWIFIAGLAAAVILPLLLLVLAR